MCQRLGMGKWPYTDVMRGPPATNSTNNMTNVRSSKTAIVQHRCEVMGDMQRQHDPQSVFLLMALQAAERDAVGFWRRYGQGVDAPWLEELCKMLKKGEKEVRKLKRGTKGFLALKAFKEGAKSVKKRIPLKEDNKKTEDVAPEDTLSMEDYKPDATSEVDSSIDSSNSSNPSNSFWPLITDQFNFCALFEDTEDVLGLGPVSGEAMS
jgi:hypothetical protein